MIRRDEREVLDEETDDLAQFVANHAYSHQIANNPNAWTCSARCVAQSILLLGLRQHDKRLRAEAHEDGYLLAVRDHQSREDGDPYCRWPTSPNPHRRLTAFEERDRARTVEERDRANARIERERRGS